MLMPGHHLNLIASPRPNPAASSSMIVTLKSSLDY